MEQIFFTTILIVAISLILLSVWFKKPVLAIFGAGFFILLAIFCLIGVEVSSGNTLVSNYGYVNTTLVNQTVSNINLYTTYKDTTSFLAYGLLGLAFLLMAVLDLIYSVGGGVPENGEDN